MSLEKLEIEAGTARGILSGMKQDFADLERWWPASKRGSNAQRFLDMLKEKRRVALQCLDDGLAD